MVALKRILSSGIHSPHPLKQERRGGIETQSRDGEEYGFENRSRNAVVALKRRRLQWNPTDAESKQERRGGIETRPSNHTS